MFPSQRTQYIFRVPSGSQTQDGNVANVSVEGVDATRNVPWATSKIEIRHTKPSMSASNAMSKTSSLNYLSKVNRRVTFNASTFKSVQSVGALNEQDSEIGEQSAMTMESTASDSTPSESTKTNEIFGQVAIQALCNRGSVVDFLGVDQCMCQSRIREAEEIERLKELDPETQKDELCKLMIQLVEDQADKNAELLEVQAQQKLFVAKPAKAPKVKHIICVGGRTLDGREIPVGAFPNSFAEVKELADLRKDPPGFKRYTAKFDMKGFRDEEISLTNERNILRVTGTRRKMGCCSQKKVVEEVALPPGVYADTLKIGRNAKGALIVQEPWKF